MINWNIAFTCILICVSQPFFKNDTRFTTLTINIFKIESPHVVPLLYGLVMFNQRGLFTVYNLLLVYFYINMVGFGTIK